MAIPRSFFARANRAIEAAPGQVRLSVRMQSNAKVFDIEEPFSIIPDETGGFCIEFRGTRGLLVAFGGEMIEAAFLGPKPPF